MFGENLYVIYFICYEVLEYYFFVFVIRVVDCWLLWEEVKFYVGLFDFLVVLEFGSV